MTVFKDVQPLSCFLFLVPTAACLGAYERNILKFTTPDFKSLTYECDGKNYPTNGYHWNAGTFDRNSVRSQARDAYLDLFKCLQQQYGSANNGLTFDAWLNGSMVIGVQFSDLPPSNEYQMERKSGDTRLKFELNQYLLEEHNLFVIGVFQSEVLLDSSSAVSKNYLV